MTQKSKAELYRNRGAQLRAIAVTATSIPAREDLVHLARLWEELARFAEGGVLPYARAKIRARADSLRNEARHVPSPVTRERMLAIAEQYVLLGDAFEAEENQHAAVD